MRTLGTVLIGGMLVLALPAIAVAKSPVRMTPDGTAILVNKDVGDERWVITLDLERATVTGNVFVGNTRAQFFWCGIVDATGDPADLATQILVLHCFTADACADVAGCRAGFDEWRSIGEVRLPGSFFLP